jgi:hypothetical protein
MKTPQMTKMTRGPRTTAMVGASSPEPALAAVAAGGSAPPTPTCGDSGRGQSSLAPALCLRRQEMESTRRERREEEEQPPWHEEEEEQQSWLAAR